MALSLLLLSSSPKPPQNLPLHSTLNPSSSPRTHSSNLRFDVAKRDFTLKAAAFSLLSLTLALIPPPTALSASNFPGISNTKSWSRFFGDGFSIRVPPQFDDVLEPEDYTAGFSFYGDKAKPRVFAARFASPDRSEALSVVVRPSNQLKITFLEAKDITDIGSIKDAAKIFVPGRATLHSARTLKIKEADALRTYYFYEFSIEDQHVVLVAAVNSGNAFIAGATAPQSKWESDGVKLRSAAISLSVQ